MTTAKQEAAKLNSLPDDSTFDEILRELAFARMIERGLADSDRDRTLSHEEVGQRIASWDAALHRVGPPKPVC